MDLPYIEALSKKLLERQSVYVQRIISGAFTEIGEYKLIAGKLQGLREAEEAAKELYREILAKREGKHEGQKPEVIVDYSG
jgi:hypothetical protein